MLIRKPISSEKVEHVSHRAVLGEGHGGEESEGEGGLHGGVGALGGVGGPGDRALYTGILSVLMSGNTWDIEIQKYN